MASTVLWKERRGGKKKEEAKIGFAADLMTEARNKIFQRLPWIDSCGGGGGGVGVGERRGGAERVSDALQDRWSLGELHSAEIPRKSATRFGIREEVEEEGWSRSLVSGNDLTQQTESSGSQSRGERRGGATSPPPGSTHA
ncbi:hypothetical protein D9C73_012367 [Collichthys lucidus]|uniref:Uncharacterized protein n=1 Tax=Collichthys lucidus TaxID=240159 RepID=A0A4U5UUB8_COLLU|nr:hypothetical protein D9C73_012367 [Collichthys lucidus]